MHQIENKECQEIQLVNYEPEEIQLVNNKPKENTSPTIVDRLDAPKVKFAIGTSWNIWKFYQPYELRKLRRAQICIPTIQNLKICEQIDAVDN